MYTITPNRKAAIATINWAEGNPQYNQLFNYVPFNNYGPHPNKVITAGGYSSTAAGAGQFIHSTWIDTCDELGMPDFMSPENQDQGIIHQVYKAGVLDEIDNGNIKPAITALSKVWASFPCTSGNDYQGNPCKGTSYYGQGGKKEQDIINYFNDSLNYFGGEGNILSPISYNQSVKKKLIR